MPATVFKTEGEDPSCGHSSGNNSSVSDGGSFDPIIRCVDRHGGVHYKIMIVSPMQHRA
jgi:hypothetical protein